MEEASGRRVGLLYEELSYAVLGCVQRVHAALGPGFPEVVYRRAMEQELRAGRIPFRTVAPFEVTYRDAVCGSFRADLLIDEKIILELKAVDRLCKEHEAQTLSYLKASKMRVGFLVNFGELRARVKRFVN